MNFGLRTIGIALTLSLLLKPVFAADEQSADEDDEWIPGELSASVTFATDYVFRGISQTDHKPAAQGGISYSVDTGVLGTSVYGGLWGSNVDFNDGDKATVELDLSFGLAGEIADTGVGWTLGGLYYWYPDANKSDGKHFNYDFWEISITLSYSPVEEVGLTLGYAYSPDFFGASGSASYPTLSVSYAPTIPWFGLSLDGRVGRQFVESNSKFGAEDYWEWRLAATATIKKYFNIGVEYTQTDLSKSDCFSGTNLCGARVNGFIGASF